MNNGKHGQGTHCTKMGANKSAENTPNVWDFDKKKASLGVLSPWTRKLDKTEGGKKILTRTYLIWPSGKDRIACYFLLR